MGRQKSASITITAFKPRRGRMILVSDVWRNGRPRLLSEAVRNLHQDNMVFENAGKKLLPPRVKTH